MEKNVARDDNGPAGPIARPNMVTRPVMPSMAEAISGCIGVGSSPSHEAGDIGTGLGSMGASV